MNEMLKYFLYASYPPNNVPKIESETEMVDTRVYRLGEIKDRKIKAVEYVLKKSAVDCVLNRNGNIYNNDKLFNIVTSCGRKLKINMSDVPGSRECSYTNDCNYECIWMPNKNKKYKINIDTYNSRFAKTDIQNIKKIVKDLYRFSYIYVLDEFIIEIQKKYKTLEKQFIYQGISEMLDNINEPIYDQYNRQGYLIYRGSFYIYQPLEFNYLEAPMYYRSRVINEKPVLYIFDQDIEENINTNYNVQDKKLSGKDIQKLIFTEMEKLMKELTIEDKNKMFIILGMVVDPLPNKEKVSLLKNLVQIYYDTQKKMEHIYQIELLRYFNKILVYQYRDVDYGKEIGDHDDKIIGFKISSKVYCYNKESKLVSECNTELRDKIKLNQKIKNIKEKVKIFQLNKIYGFMEKWKNGDYIFKIYDETKGTGAMTLDLKRSKRSEIKGKKCNNFNNNELKEINNKLNIKDSSKQIKIKCRNIEFMLRKYNLENYENRRWFITAIDNIK